MQTLPGVAFRKPLCPQYASELGQPQNQNSCLDQKSSRLNLFPDEFVVEFWRRW